MRDGIVLGRDAEPLPTRSRRRTGRVLVILALLAGAGGGFVWWQGSRTREPGAPPPAEAIPVVLDTVTQRDVPLYLDALGTVQAYNSVTIRPMVDGQLLELRFREGQDVRAGDVLARIDPRTYQATLDQATAKQAQDEATLANARLDLARYQKLVQNNYTTAQTADTQRATVAQLEAQVRQDQASIDNARAQLSFTTITAPIDGRIGMRAVDVGNILRTSDSTGLLTITTLRPISVVFSLPQQDLPQVAAAMADGMPAVLALAQNGASVLDRGVLAVLDNQVDATTGTIKLKATFPNADLKLWPGGFVGVRLLAQTRHDATVVPPAAVQRGPRGAYVFVVGADDAAIRRAVTIGHEDEQAALVETGLQPGERVVVDGAARLTEGAKIRALGAPLAAPDK